MARERGRRRDFPNRYVLPLHPAGERFDFAALFPHPAALEADLGCGRGRFLMAHAALAPERNFIGVDILTRRLGKFDLRATARELTNIRLLQGDIRFALKEVFPPASLSVAFLLFPDPWPKHRHHNRRILQPSFLDLIHRVLTDGGLFHFATDHADYFEAACKLFAGDQRFEAAPPFEPTADERTDFEMLFSTLSRSTHRASLRKKGASC
ncbi:MAG: tRNA (guanosine(46)-N7)-methyltransferase TrmB [bacterium]